MKWPKGTYCLMIILMITACTDKPSEKSLRVFYVDSETGDDHNDGLSEASPWKSLSRVEETRLAPGDTVRFRRGSGYQGRLLITDSGQRDLPIVLDDYGDPDRPAPGFTNPLFDEARKEYGNCIRLQGDYLVVRDLYFHSTPAELPGETGSFLTMWELGAVYIDKSAENCIVTNNEFFDCGVGVKSYGPYARIKSNFIHDCNRVLKEWSWGPIGIWLGGDHQEVSHNTILNYSAIDPRITWGPNSYGGGADGSAIEIDDARVPKSDISIHHNYTRDNQGFLEVTWTDVDQNPEYINFDIHHNISDDYQQFVALWRGAGFKIDHNTIVRRKVNANDWGVFNITQFEGKNLIRNNIIVTEQEIPVFNLGRLSNAAPGNIIENNVYFAASGELNMGLEGPGANAVFGDPDFRNYQMARRPEDYFIGPQSIAIGAGRSLDYQTDFSGQTLDSGQAVDAGASSYSARQNSEDR